MELAIKPCDVFACRVITEMIVLVIIIAYMEVVSQPEETRVCVTQDITEIIVPKLVIAVKMAPVARTGRVCNSGYYGDDCSKTCNCSGNGTCKPDGTCVCNPGYTGLTCSVKSSNSGNGSGKKIFYILLVILLLCLLVFSIYYYETHFKAKNSA